MRGRLARFSIAVLAAGVLAVSAGGTVAAHPLGNFTINHYAGVRVGVDAIVLDVVIDMAEIPAFQERSRIDTTADGTVDAAEQAAEQAVACDRLAGELHLTVAGVGVALASTGAELTFPAGVGGLPTLRLTCGYTAAIPGSLGADSVIRFEDRSYAERIGWREIVVQGDGAVVTAPGLPVSSISERLTTYPADLLSSPLDVRVAEFRASPPAATASAAPSPSPVPTAVVPAAPSAPAAATPLPTPAPAPSVVGAIPGGVEEEISRLLAVSDLTPIALLGSLLVAFVLGAVHAVSPGHGKTVMAAYLVGSRGSLRHAVALGLTVTVSHTLGVLALALITVFASNVIPPERLYPILGVASGTLVIGIGLWLLYSRIRAWRADRAHAAAHRREHELAHAQGHAHEHEHEEAHEHEPEHDDEVTGEHSHGPFRHSHVPPAGTTLTWRSLFTLGLAGGLVPSASALLLLLGSVSANRPAYGVVLVLAFGLGMAVVLGGLGILLVHASRLLEHARPNGAWQRLWTALPAATAVVVVAAGVYITSQAIQTTF